MSVEDGALQNHPNMGILYARAVINCSYKGIYGARAVSIDVPVVLLNQPNS